MTKDADEPATGTRFRGTGAQPKGQGTPLALRLRVQYGIRSIRWPVCDDGFARSIPWYDMMDADVNKTTMKPYMRKLAVVAALLLLAALALLGWMKDQMVIWGPIDWPR